MSRFIIEIYKTKQTDWHYINKAILSKDDFQNFLNLLGENDLLSKFLNAALLMCEKCGSFVLPANTLVSLLLEIEFKNSDYINYGWDFLEKLIQPISDFQELEWPDSFKRPSEDNIKFLEIWDNFEEGSYDKICVKTLNGETYVPDGYPYEYIYEENAC